MPPENASVLPDSALGLTNIHQAAGLDDRARKHVWETTRRAIEHQALELQGEIAAGATAVVFDAREKVGGRLVGRRLVVKVVVEPENQHALDCFRREVKVLASEHVPTDVVPGLKYYQDVDDRAAPTVQPFLVAERIDGRPIFDYVRYPRPLPMSERIALVERCFLALDRLHSCNILHGDVSPNNVLIQKDDVVRLIDLGQAKTLRGVGTRSVSVAGGTPDYQPDSVLRGEERLAAWVDIHALASVAFHALTDRAPGKKESDARGNASALHDARVPSAVARVLRKALREKDQRKETDPELYASAAAVARDLHAWHEGQARCAQRKRQGIAAVLVALLMLIPTWVGWSRYWAEIRADQTREVVSLRAQASRLSHDAHPRVKQITERVDQLARQRDDALARGQAEQADVITPKLLDTLRQVISLRLGLERCLPLRQALGEVLTRAPWVDEAEAIATQRKELEQRFTEIGAQIERGNTDAAWVGLGTLNAALADLARRNVQAARVAEPRARYKRAVTGLSAQLRERGAADPEFTQLSQTANAAEEAWKAGDWPTAERLFGLAHQALDGWLNGKETSEQLTARRLAEGASAVAAANRERALRSELARLEQLEKDLTGQVQGLQAQIARLTDQNLKDRDAYVAASKDLSSERARRASAEIQVKNLTASLDQEREALKTAETALATERSAKEVALKAQASAEPVWLPKLAPYKQSSRSNRQTQSASAGMGATMGVRPDYADESKDGLKLTGVLDGGPAAKAGLRGGDRIIRIAGKPIGTIYDYIESLKGYKASDKVDVVVRRDGKEITLPVRLSAPGH